MSLNDIKVFITVIDGAISNLENGVETSERKYSYDAYDITTLDKEQTENAKSRGYIVINNDSDLLFKISQSLTNKNLKENYVLGAIDDAVKEKIANDIGKNIFKDGQYSFVITSDDIRHIAEHFKNTNDIFDAIFKLYDTVSNYDTVELNMFGTQTELVFNKSYTNAD